MSSTQYRLHLTELSWRIHCTAPEDKVKLANVLSSAVIDQKASRGIRDYKPGKITVGNILAYFRADVDKQQDYKYAKIDCENKDDYDTLLDLKYINIENNMARILPNMTKEDIAKYFNN